MAERRAPQPRHSIDVGFAVVVVEKDALPAVDHERPGVPDRGEIGIGVNQRFDVANGEIAEHGVYFRAEEPRYSPRKPSRVKAFHARSLQIWGAAAEAGPSRCHRPLPAEADR